MLKTPEKIRELQRKLYQKAKQEKEYRFYLLYDKVYRLAICPIAALFANGSCHIFVAALTP